jgi:hypothetical protein
VEGFFNNIVQYSIRVRGVGTRLKYIKGRKSWKIQPKPPILFESGSKPLPKPSILFKSGSKPFLDPSTLFKTLARASHFDSLLQSSLDSSQFSHSSVDFISLQWILLVFNGFSQSSMAFASLQYILVTPLPSTFPQTFLST